MKIEQYLKENGIKSVFFAEKIGASPEQFSRWLTGKTVPRIQMIIKIQAETKGKVKAEDWLTE